MYSLPFFEFSPDAPPPSGAFSTRALINSLPVISPPFFYSLTKRAFPSHGPCPHPRTRPRPSETATLANVHHPSFCSFPNLSLKKRTTFSFLSLQTVLRDKLPMGASGLLHHQRVSQSNLVINSRFPPSPAILIRIRRLN